MEPCKINGTTQRPSHAQGLEGKEFFSPSGRGKKMSLTSPPIDQALSLIDPEISAWTFNEQYRDFSPIKTSRCDYAFCQMSEAAYSEASETSILDSGALPRRLRRKITLGTGVGLVCGSQWFAQWCNWNIAFHRGIEHCSSNSRTRASDGRVVAG